MIYNSPTLEKLYGANSFDYSNHSLIDGLTYLTRICHFFFATYQNIPYCHIIFSLNEI